MSTANDTASFATEKDENLSLLKDDASQQTHKVRKSYTYREKAHILMELERKPILVVCQEYGVNERTLRSWRQQRAQIEQTCTSHTAIDVKKQMTGKYPKIEDHLYLWYVEARARGIRVNRKMLMQKALDLNTKLGGKTTFGASRGWLGRWRLRKGIHSLRDSTRKKQADADTSEKSQIFGSMEDIKDVFSSSDLVTVIMGSHASDSNASETTNQITETKSSCTDMRNDSKLSDGRFSNFTRNESDLIEPTSTESLEKPMKQECLDAERMTIIETKTLRDLILEDNLYSWYRNAMSKGVPVPEPALKLKALTLNAELRGSVDFSASNSWIHQWKLSKGLLSDDDPVEERPDEVGTEEWRDDIQPEERLQADEPSELMEKNMDEPTYVPPETNLESNENIDEPMYVRPETNFESEENIDEPTYVPPESNFESEENIDELTYIPPETNFESEDTETPLEIIWKEPVTRIVKRKTYSYGEKTEILRQLDNKSVSKVSQELNINERTLHKWKQKRAEIERICEQASDATKKRLSRKLKLEDSLYTWYLEKQNEGVFVSASTVKRRAIALNKALNGDSKFTASPSWVEQWRVRKGIQSFAHLSKKSIAKTEANAAYKPESHPSNANGSEEQKFSLIIKVECVSNDLAEKT